MMEQEALKRAVEIAGGQSALARLIGRKQAHVWNWLNVSARVPAEAAVDIERATNGKVTRHELRPDIFEPPADTRPCDTEAPTPEAA